MISKCGKEQKATTEREKMLRIAVGAERGTLEGVLAGLVAGPGWWVMTCLRLGWPSADG